jgi:type IV pilus assembly protein PilB
MSKIFSHLIEEKLLTPEGLQALQDKRCWVKKPIQDLLIESGTISEEDFLKAVRQVSPFPKVDLSQIELDPAVCKILSLEQASYYGVLPIKKEIDALWLAMSNPGDIMAVDEIRFLTGLDIRPFLCAKSQLGQYQTKLYRTDAPVHEILQDTIEDHRVELRDEKDFTGNEIADLAKSAPDESSVIRLVNKIICDAVAGYASDVHIEPQEKAVDIRYRVDGNLQSIIKIPRELHSRLVARIKILAKLDIAEKRKIQEGRIKAVLEDKEIDLRVSLLPVFYGEKIVLRILGNEQMRFALDNLGFEPDQLDLFQSSLAKTQGVVLVTGPTGSGKTTSLYAALKQIKNETINIVTIEDPIEYLIEGINQIQLNPHKDVTFASGLRSVLRQDPDVLLIGEIRDAQTAEAAFQASLTGHLVFATLHTNSAVSTITRLMNIGVEPYLISSSLTLVVAQRLVRVICPHCQTSYQPEKEMLARMRPYFKDFAFSRFSRGRGCLRCGFTGFSGRTSIFEILKVDDIIQNSIFNRIPEQGIFKKALNQGMRTLVESGIAKVIRGITTLEEVARVTNVSRLVEKADETIFFSDLEQSSFMEI